MARRLERRGDHNRLLTGSGTPTFIQLIQTLSVSTHKLLSPGHLHLHQGVITATYTSLPFNNTTYAGSPYSGMYVLGAAGQPIYSFTQSDQSIIRVSNTDYRQSFSLY